MAETMMGAILPGNSTVELREFPIPTPGHGQVLVKTMASTICGSDIRCIYREHTGKGAEGYIPGTIAGHEPCGQIVAEGPGLKRFKKGDRVIVYHISGCGVCHDCRMGYQISCTSEHRAAYGWQRDGGMRPTSWRMKRIWCFCPSRSLTRMGRRWPAGLARSTKLWRKSAVREMTRCWWSAWGRWAWRR